MSRKSAFRWLEKALRRVRDYLSDVFSEDMRADLIRREDRAKRLKNSRPRLGGIPFLGKLSRCNHGPGSIVGLILIIVLFTAIKSPYLALPFTGIHSMKYSSVVEPALYMAERNDPTWFQKKYQAEVDTNPEGIRRKFTHLPLYEWGLYLTYELVPFGQLELKTRLFSHTLGLLILVGAYLFFSMWLPRRLALIVVFLLAINPLIAFATYVPVLDSLITLLMFVSLILLSSYSRSRDVRYLFWAGIVFGVGNSVKYSLFLWLAPLGLVLLFFTRTGFLSYLRDCCLYVFLGIMPILAVRTSIALLPTSAWQAVILFLPWVLFSVVLYQVLRRKEAVIDGLVARLWEHKILLVSLSVMAIVLAAPVPGLLRSDLNQFLTNSDLLFNFRMYEAMLEGFKDNMTSGIFWLGVIGLLLIPFFNVSNLRRITASFAAGCVVYWIVAAKGIFIHNYYTIIIMILFSLLAALPIYAAVSVVTRAAPKLAVFAACAALIFPGACGLSSYMLGYHEDVSDVISYIRENTRPDELIMHHGLLTPLIIYTDRQFVYPHSFDYDGIRREVKELGFAGAMAKHKVKFLFSPYYGPIYEDFVPFFEGKEPHIDSWNRDVRIANAIGATRPDLADAQEQILQIVEGHAIRSKFKQEAEFGEWGQYKLYSFRD